MKKELKSLCLIYLSYGIRFIGMGRTTLENWWKLEDLTAGLGTDIFN